MSHGRKRKSKLSIHIGLRACQWYLKKSILLLTYIWSLQRACYIHLMCFPVLSSAKCQARRGPKGEQTSPAIISYSHSCTIIFNANLQYLPIEVISGICSFCRTHREAFEEQTDFSLKRTRATGDKNLKQTGRQSCLCLHICNVLQWCTRSSRTYPLSRGQRGQSLKQPHTCGSSTACCHPLWWGGKTCIFFININMEGQAGTLIIK